MEEGLKGETGRKQVVVRGINRPKGSEVAHGLQAANGETGLRRLLVCVTGEHDFQAAIQGGRVNSADAADKNGQLRVAAGRASLKGGGTS